MFGGRGKGKGGNKRGRSAGRGRGEAQAQGDKPKPRGTATVGLSRPNKRQEAEAEPVPAHEPEVEVEVGVQDVNDNSPSASRSASHSEASASGTEDSQGQTKQQHSGRRGPKPYYNWTREEEDLLADWIEDHPCLYNDTLADFHNRGLKDHLWQQFAEKIGPSCTAEFAITHYNSLRARLNHIMIMLDPKRRDPKSGSEGKQCTDKDQWIERQISILRSFIVHRPTTSSRPVRPPHKDLPSLDESTTSSEKSAAAETPGAS